MLGLAFSLLSRGTRLERAAEDDAAYRVMMFNLGSVAPFPHDSVQLERALIRGELAGHLLALLLGVVAWRIFRSPAYLYPSVWAIAFVGDWVGGRLAARLDRRRSHAEEKLAERMRTLRSEAAEEEHGAEPPPPREEG